MFWGNGFFVLGSLLPGGHHCPHFHKAIAALGKYVLLTETHFSAILAAVVLPRFSASGKLFCLVKVTKTSVALE